MLDINFIRENPEEVKKGIAKKQLTVDIDRLLSLDKTKRDILQKIEALRAEQNNANKEIIKLKNDVKKQKLAEMKKIADQVKDVNNKLGIIEKDFTDLMRQIPNLPAPNVKVGRGEQDNQVARHEGDIPKFEFDPKDYVEIAEELDIIDTKRAAKVAGSRFGYIKGDLVLLEFALIRFAFDILTKAGFRLVLPPVMLNDNAMRGMGYLDRGAEEVYKTQDDLYLIGTSEQSLGAMHMDEILDSKKLPLHYAGFSTCFRREAGSYGKDTKGILRVHQFNKVEMFVFCKPEQSEDEHKLLLRMEENLMQALKLPYRVMDICSGDLGDPAAKKWDIEAWFPGSSEYRETHSTSNCTDWQARRLNIRYKDENNKNQFVHTLNGTAFSERPLLAILENYQTEAGGVRVPDVLREYVGKEMIE
ncbi:serine--tRNA ligase [Patescibacteria group bacterium]|nr:serine--tRNA ligase [Patescibacteria group bacterium]MBU4512952.1 serine--tRNA ligase [Patescibacteria group bacterium]MCG2692989.1 serine--tRNA ligase [Candidatus Parcubacteria bacterium]